jgi:hypothetical protein
MKLSIKPMSSVSALTWQAFCLSACCTWQCLNTGAGFLDGFSSVYPVSAGHEASLTPYWEPGTQSRTQELADSFLPWLYNQFAHV